MANELPGGDGLLHVGPDELLLVANQMPGKALNSIVSLKSNDNWMSAEVVESRELGNVYPTTCTALNGKVYVLSSHLDEWIGAKEAARGEIVQQARRAEIRQVGTIARE
jgi:hypothetical protein